VYSTEIGDCENGVDHGTAVAELVVDMAPGVQLFLADPESPLDYRDAIRWMTSAGVRIINSSASSGYLFDGPGDGTAGRSDSSYEEIDLAVALGALWVNSAGNEGDAGWIGDWADADADDTLDWAPGDEGNTIHLEAGQQIRVALRWPDEWGASANDYDIALFDGDTALAVGSDFQTGGGDPYEVFDFAAGDAGDYDLVIRRYDAEPAVGLQVLIYSSGPLTLQYSVAATTLPSPADSANPGMVSVGAVDVDDPDEIETYSSRGPTVDGRIKPDLVAPDCIATITFGEFCGTSSSAPIVAGGAALALQADPTMGAPELADYLRDNAAPLGDPSPNSTYGHGRLKLGEPVAVMPAGHRVGLRASTRSLTWPAELTLTATLTPPIPAGRVVYFQASANGTDWTSVGSAATEDGTSAEVTFAPTASRTYRAMALGTAVTSGSVEVAVHQRLSVRPSIAVAPAGRPVRVIPAGTVVSFDAVVRPARGDQPRPVVQYVVYQRIASAWVLDRRVDVTADRSGVARVPVRFDVPGQWYVRARAVATKGAAISTWSPTFRYDVTGSSTGALERSWRADVSGGSATISSYSGGTSVLALSVTGFASSQPVVIGVQRACGASVPRVATLRSVRTSAGGALGSSIILSAAQAAAIARASADGATLSLVLRSGADTRCAPLVPRPTIVASIATGEEASAVATDGNDVWVTNIFEDTVSRIDPATNVVTATIEVPGFPYGVASDGTSAWVTHVASGALTRIDIATNEVLDTASIGELAGNITMGDGAVWVVIQGEDEVVKIDARSGEVIARIGVASDPYGIAYADGSVWVTSPAEGIVTRIDAKAEEIVAEIEVAGVNDIAARDGAVWVSVRPVRAASGAIVRIDTDSDSAAERIAVGFEPAGLAIAGDSVYVAMGGEPTLVQVRGGRVTARIPVAMKSLAIAFGFRSLWLLHPYGTGIAGSGLYAGGVTRLNI
jgi:YVTN family beta-propeller protein